jgi:bacillithiol synthase
VGRAFATSYLAAEPAASAFFAPGFLDPATRIARARAAAERAAPSQLLQVLLDQQAVLPPSRAREAQMETLAAGKAAVVVTGQQVGLFLGPLYSFYKAASAVAVARALQAESGVPCVPVFWLQTEDHDFTEIRRAAVADSAGEPVLLELADEHGGEGRISLAHRALPEQVADLLDLLAGTLRGESKADEVLRILRDCYRPGIGLATAFASLLATLFAEHGLLVFDPRDARVAALAEPLYRDLIDHAEHINVRLSERAAALEASGFAIQVPIRERSSLVFFHRGSPEGPRFRIQRLDVPEGAQAHWQLVGTSEAVSHDELLATLARAPLRFSSSALARPILQDHLFPTAAYVGGPGEINYFAQLAPLYQHVGLLPPLLVPRARFVVLDARTRRRLDQLGLAVPDLTAPPQVLRARVKASLSPGLADPADLRALVADRVAPAVEQIALAVDRAALSLGRASQRARQSVSHTMDRLIDRYARGLLERDTATLRRLHELEQSLRPDGIPQERFYAWPSFAGRIGVREFLELVMERLSSDGPFNPRTHELRP